jgi:hypothetical protein
MFLKNEEGKSRKRTARLWGLTPVATWKAEMGKISSLLETSTVGRGKNGSQDPISKITRAKTDWMSDSSGRAPALQVST